MVIKASMPSRKRAITEEPLSPPSIMGIQLVRDDGDRVIGWTVPNGASFYGRVFKSKDTRRIWQCVIRCQGFTMQLGDVTPQGVADLAAEKINAFVRAFTVGAVK